MSAVELIEKEIEKLPRRDLFQLKEWLDGRFNDEWDKEFEEDVQAGRLEALAEEAIREFRERKTTPFPDGE